MIKLKNVSKFYYSKGVIASGFSKVNLEFNLGEFVAITGESGSGKSTLLNVISGLDSYEEGEMYINGEETSHYTEKDFEDYRRKYIGNIFQNFNLVNSYTVYQNVELVLLLNGNKKKKIKKNVIELIKKVGLYQFRNTKVSKLSGGQKQRVAIARALAKDTPIIIADEPTGNLDSTSATEIIKLLSEISKDKLVIIVTHNYDQVEKYVTRKIKMHDGKILEDKVLKNVDEVNNSTFNNYLNITSMNKIRLGLRNTFNIIPKFLLIFAVYLFVTISLVSEYASFKEDEYLEKKSGENFYFSNTDDSRIVIKKKNGENFTEVDYNKIKSLDNVDHIVKNDVLLDSEVTISDNKNIWIYSFFDDINNFKYDVDYGRMPVNENEVIISGYETDYYLTEMKEEMLNTDFYLIDRLTGEVNYDSKIKIVGIKYSKDYSYYHSIYGSKDLIKKIEFGINQQYSTIEVEFMNNFHTSNYYNSYFNIVANEKVRDGYAIISRNFSSMCPNDNCINKDLNVNVNNLYYNDVLNLKVSSTYTKNNIKNLLGISDFEQVDGAVYISVNDYNKLFNKNPYQSSVFVKNSKMIDKTIEELNELEYNTLKISDTLVNYGATGIIRIFKVIVTSVLIVALFFISYFIIRIILKSRNVYFSVIRMLGATEKVCKNLLMIELITVFNLSFISLLLMLILNNFNILHIGFINIINEYLSMKEYIMLYLILLCMSYLISVRYSNKIFKKSAISTFREEV